MRSAISPTSYLPTIYIDADACPVKEDIYRIAKRYQLKVFVVSGIALHVPAEMHLTAIVSGNRFDSADDWIDEHIQKGDIAVTNDLLLAARVLKREASAIDPRGKILDENNIGEALATRELMTELRQSGALNLGPKQMGKKHRSNFLSQFDLLINRQLRK